MNKLGYVACSKAMAPHWADRKAGQQSHAPVTGGGRHCMSEHCVGPLISVTENFS